MAEQEKKAAEKEAEDRQRALSFEAGVEELVKASGIDPQALAKQAGAKNMKEFSGWVLDWTAAMAEAEQGQPQTAAKE